MLRDSLAKRDSSRARALRADSLKTPFSRAPAPEPIEIGQSLVYDRAALFGSGALTLQDLLDRIAGITGFRSGWIASPMVSAYLGDVRRVRIYFDGVELDELDPRTAAVPDLSQVLLWTLEELRIERGASEVRVYLRTWRVDHTTPYTRTDISTGDQQTNLYRGFFGRRYHNGSGFQLGAQQYGTTPPLRGSPSSDQLSLLGRVGWARGPLSVDAFALRTGRNRGAVRPRQIRGASFSEDSIPPLQSTRTDAYVRAAVGDPGRNGLWMQALAAAQKYEINHGSKDALGGSSQDTVPDTTRFSAQYVLAGGLTWAGVRLTATERLRVIGGRRLATPSARAEFVTNPLAISVFAEGRGPDSLARGEVAARLTPLPFVSLAAAAGRSLDQRRTDSSVASNYLRAEAGLRVQRLWFIGGVIRRDSVLLRPPVVFGPSYAAVDDPAAVGFTGAIRGPIYGALKANLLGIRWNDPAGFYRPRYQTRGEFYLQTNWLSRFPSGNFGLLASFVHEYRSRSYLPVTGSGSALDVRSVPDSRTLNFLLEIRILSAVVSYQFRNIRGEQYQLVPGYLMPRQTQFYGVRWEFWN
jgi:hypothetical protein